MGTISTNGIASNQVIRAEHVLRIINALTNVSANDILVSGSLRVTGSTDLSGSLEVTGGITGSLLGTSSNATTASYAINATSSSYALTASYAISASYEINYETSSSYAENATSASYALTSSYALNATSASYSLNSTNAASATSASYALTSSYALNATSASYSLNSTNAASSTSASYALTSSYASSSTSASFSTNAASSTSASYALTASYALNSPGGGTINTGSLLLTASATDNIITFTKGDASTFNITINTGSASSINTGSFATTGSNQFSGSQGITGSVLISGSQNITGSLSVDSGTIINSDAFSIMRIYPNIINIENQGSPFDYTLLSLGVLSYNSASNAQQLLFPASLSTGIKAITLPNDTGTVALTYNTVTTSSFNSFTSSYNDKTGSFATTGSNTFTGNQIVNANLTLTSSATMSIVIPGGFPGMQITKDQVSINPNLNSNRALLYGGNLQLSAVDGYSGLYLTNRNGSSDTGSIEIHRIHFQGKDTDANSGLKAGLRVFQSAGTGSTGHINFYTSASTAFGFLGAGDLDMRISSGSSIELFRNTTITGSVSITSVLTLAPNDPLPSLQPTGSIAVSGSGVDCKPYFYNGSTWTSMI